MKGQGRPKVMPRIPVRTNYSKKGGQPQPQDGIINNAPAFNKGGLVQRLKENLTKTRSIS